MSDAREHTGRQRAAGLREPGGRRDNAGRRERLAAIYYQALAAPRCAPGWREEAMRLASRYLATGCAAHRLAFARHVEGILRSALEREAGE